MPVQFWLLLSYFGTNVAACEKVYKSSAAALIKAIRFVEPSSSSLSEFAYYLFVGLLAGF